MHSFKIHTSKHFPQGGEFTMAVEVESASGEYIDILS